MNAKGKNVNYKISMASFGGNTVRMWHTQTSALLSVKLILQIVFHIIYSGTHILTNFVYKLLLCLTIRLL